VDAWDDVPWGTWEIVKPGSGVAVLAFGATLPYALAAAGDDPRIAVVNARFVKPLDAAMLERFAEAGTPLVTVEDHVLHGGFGAAVAEFLSDRGGGPRLVRLGIDDQHVPHGDPAAQHEALGYGPSGIRAALARLGFGRPEPIAVAERR
jgi:1-deoxy-D-xylulose-5-phosphate synthase